MPERPRTFMDTSTPWMDGERICYWRPELRGWWHIAHESISGQAANFVILGMVENKSDASDVAHSQANRLGIHCSNVFHNDPNDTEKDMAQRRAECLKAEK